MQYFASLLKASKPIAPLPEHKSKNILSLTSIILNKASLTLL